MFSSMLFLWRDDIDISICVGQSFVALILFIWMMRRVISLFAKLTYLLASPCRSCKVVIFCNKTVSLSMKTISAIVSMPPHRFQWYLRLFEHSRRFFMCIENHNSPHYRYHFDLYIISFANQTLAVLIHSIGIRKDPIDVIFPFINILKWKFARCVHFMDFPKTFMSNDA